MKILPVLLLLLFAACASNPPKKVENKIVADVPALVGKSEAEIIQILGEPKTKQKPNKADEINFDYENAEVKYFISFRNGKANDFQFTFNQGESSETVLAERIGLTLPAVSWKDKNAIYTRYEGIFNGKHFDRIGVAKSDGGYNIITVQVAE